MTTALMLSGLILAIILVTSYKSSAIGGGIKITLQY